MKITVLIDNISDESFQQEWGLAIHIAHNGQQILLDTGASEKFAENAKKMGIALEQVNFGALSHAHYDHSDGMGAFFAENGTAKFYLQSACGEDCYARAGLRGRYIGIEKGTLKRYAERLVYVENCAEIASGVYLLGHSTPKLAEKGRASGMYRRRGLRRRDDDFAHEQSLVIRGEKGLVVFNSCCHAGADVIVQEVRSRFPEEPIAALIGGFHLYETPDEQVRSFARRLLESGVDRVWTGHCTGPRAMEILEQEMPGRANRLYTGLVIEL